MTVKRLYVVLGDVVQSRQIADRESFQHQLNEACGEVNTSYADDIYADFSVLKGVDEIGGALSSISNIYDIVQRLLETLRPHEIRLSLAYGTIDVGAETQNVSQMDGSAFHRAAEQLSELEQSELLFDMTVGGDRFDTAVADEINLLLLLKRGWTDRQRQIIEAYQRHGNQYDTANELEITQQAVSDSLTRSFWPAVREIENRLKGVLQEYEP